jgi:lipopolysaccharide export system protein LptC
MIFFIGHGSPLEIKADKAELTGAGASYELRHHVRVLRAPDQARAQGYR